MRQAHTLNPTPEAENEKDDGPVCRRCALTSRRLTPRHCSPLQIAVLKETDGKGPYCSLVMAVVVVKDVLLFAVFATNVELAKAVTSVVRWRVLPGSSAATGHAASAVNGACKPSRRDRPRSELLMPPCLPAGLQGSDAAPGDSVWLLLMPIGTIVQSGG